MATFTLTIDLASYGLNPVPGQLIRALPLTEAYPDAVAGVIHVGTVEGRTGVDGAVTVTLVSLPGLQYRIEGGGIEPVIIPGDWPDASSHNLAALASVTPSPIQPIDAAAIRAEVLALLAGGGPHTHTSAQVTDFVEAAQDAVAAMLGAGSNVTLNYVDGSNALTISSAGDGTGLDPEAIRDLMGLAIVAVGNVAVTVNDALDTITITTTATVNATDAALRDRATHTGTQAIATVAGLQAALDAKAANIVTVEAQTGTAYAPTQDDAGKLVTLTNAAAITVTLPSAASTGTRIDFVVLGAGMATFAAAGGTTLVATPSATTRAIGSAASATRLPGNVWLVVGDLA